MPRMRPSTASWILTLGCTRDEHPAMALSVLYRGFRRVLRVIRLISRSDTDLAIEVIRPSCCAMGWPP